MALPFAPLLLLGGTSLVTAAALQARGLRSDDLEPRLFSIPLVGVTVGAGAVMALVATGAMYPVVGAGLALGAIQSQLALGQVASNTDPKTLNERGGARPAWIVRSQLIPLSPP